MDWLYYILLLITAVLGLFLNILGLPGLWLMVTAHALFAWIMWDQGYVGWGSIITLIVLGLVAELFEFLAGAAGSKAAGGRTRGMMGAIVGALIGGVVGTGVIPIPVLGTIIGACGGAFIGAALPEFYDRDWRHATRVGIGAAKGRFVGIVIKTGIGVVMLLIILITALPLGGSAAPLPITNPSAPSTAPVTLPEILPTTAPATNSL